MWLRRRLPALLLAGFVGLPAVLFLRPVRDDEMAWSLRPGDWVLVLPLSPRVGEVVRLRDPLDPARHTYRRVLALGPARVSWNGLRPAVDGRRPRLLEMRRTPERVVLEEAERALLLLDPEPPRRRIPPVELPAGCVYLAADHRDDALDSRHWGPLPLSAVEGVVLLRLGPADDWRGWLSVP